MSKAFATWSAVALLSFAAVLPAVAEARFRRTNAAACNPAGNGNILLNREGCTGRADLFGARCVSPSSSVYVNNSGGQLIYSCPIASDTSFPAAQARFLTASVSGNTSVSACVQPFDGGVATCGPPTTNRSDNAVVRAVIVSAAALVAESSSRLPYLEVVSQNGAKIVGYEMLD